MTRKDFASRHGVGLSTLRKWLQRERLASDPPVKFKEVVLPAPVPRWTAAVVNPNGWIVRLQNGVELQTLP
jgi:DNA-binding transcriptional regulator YiaG